MNQLRQNNSEQDSILLVEDDHDVRYLLSIILKQENYLVHEAVNGKQALLMYITHAPNLVLTDVNMPEMDGIELTAKIRAVNSLLPIIVMSGDEDNLQPAEAAGANKTILKPLDIDVVLNLIDLFM